METRAEVPWDSWRLACHDKYKKNEKLNALNQRKIWRARVDKIARGGSSYALGFHAEAKHSTIVAGEIGKACKRERWWNGDQNAKKVRKGDDYLFVYLTNSTDSPLTDSLTSSTDRHTWRLSHTHRKQVVTYPEQRPQQRSIRQLCDRNPHLPSEYLQGEIISLCI